ncbi:MAG TPA: hypothetical protein PLJ18_11450 [Niabella sp.]|nr:hypothetical protein [Niabella sp.]
MGAIINIPNGTNNVFPLFPSINVNDVEDYYVQILDENDTPIASTTINKLVSCNDTVRIHFINSFGCVDGVTLHIANVKHSAKSEAYIRSKSVPVIKSNHAQARTAIEAKDVFVGKTTHYGENEMRWLDELFDAPLAWIESGNPKELIPIVILDSEREKVKENDAYTYEVTVEYILSHEKIIINN